MFMSCTREPDCTYRHVNVGLDQIAAAVQVGCYLRRQVPHPSMEHVTLARSVEAAGIDDEALAKAVIKRQYMMLPCLLPPKIHQRSELFGVRGREIVCFREILVEVEELPFIILVRLGDSYWIVRPSSAACICGSPVPPHQMSPRGLLASACTWA